MHQLVGSGYARPGQTSWELLDSFDLGLLIDFAYAMIVGRMDVEQREAFDAQLEATRQDRTPKVEVELSDGRVVQISQARLNKIRGNKARIEKLKG